MDDFRKAAILLQHLDPDSRQQILEKLPPAQQAQIAALLNATIEVGTAELTEIIREYQAQFEQVQTRSFVESSELSSTSTVHEPDAVEHEPELPANSIRSLFSPPQLAELLAPESDALLSAIIAHLPQTEGRELFVRFEEIRQATIADCLADQEEIAPVIAEEINEYLAEKYQAFSKSKKKGMSVLSGLLTAGGTNNQIITGRLNERDRELLAQIRPNAGATVEE